MFKWMLLLVYKPPTVVWREEDPGYLSLLWVQKDKLWSRPCQAVWTTIIQQQHVAEIWRSPLEGGLEGVMRVATRHQLVSVWSRCSKVCHVHSSDCAYPWRQQVYQTFLSVYLLQSETPSEFLAQFYGTYFIKTIDFSSSVVCWPWRKGINR